MFFTPAHILVQGLKDGSLTSCRLLETLLQHIEFEEQHGLQLNAVLATAPKDDLLRRAKGLDDERAQGRERSALHGIPILLKVAHSMVLRL